MKFEARRFLKQYLVADTPRLSYTEAFKSALGASLGVYLVLIATTHFLGNYAILAAVGATAVILFSMPHSPMAQPWSVFGGYLVSAGIGLLIGLVTTNTILGISVALAMVVVGMVALKCVHPPAGAITVFAVTQRPDGIDASGMLMAGVLLTAVAVVVVAMVINKIIGRQYPQCLPVQPVNPHRTKDVLPTVRTGITHQDLDYALKKHGTYVDVQEAELIDLYESAISHAFSRKMNTLCGDIMAKDVISISEETNMNEAWSLLHKHKIKALPVVNSLKQIVGIVTIADFLKDLARQSGNPISGLEQLISGQSESEAHFRPAVDMMTKHVLTEHVDTPVSTLIKRLSDLGMHHVPIVNSDNVLVGMITQSDLIASMYQKIVLNSR